MSSNHPVHHSGLLFGYAADGRSDPDWLAVPDGSHFTHLAKQLTLPIRPKTINSKPCTKSTFTMPGGASQNSTRLTPSFTYPLHQGCCRMVAIGGLRKLSQIAAATRALSRAWLQHTRAAPLKTKQLPTMAIFFERVEALCVQVLHKSPWSS